MVIGLRRRIEGSGEDFGLPRSWQVGASTVRPLNVGAGQAYTSWGVVQGKRQQVRYDGLGGVSG